MMMSSENNIPLGPEITYPDNKVESKLSKEEECDYYRQRFNSLKIVTEDFQNQLTFYKDRYRGMSTIQLILKESRQENVRLSKHVKALETSISILQKRLDKNGLSNSVNIQDAELFVPGASKQTFDNLAKETVRLRSLLKQENGPFGKKSANEFEDMKIALKEADQENNELKNKIKDMEEVKLKLVSDFESAIQNLNKERQEEKEKFEKELKAREPQKLLKEDEPRKMEKMQTDSGAVQELKDLLTKTVEKCDLLSDQLSAAGNQGSPSPRNDQTRIPSVSQEEYNRLEHEHKKAVDMNQKWQNYSNDRENKIHVLTERIKQLSDPHHMTAMVEEASNQKTIHLNKDLAKKDAEILELRKQITALSKDLADTRKHQLQMQQDNGTVEILKQQIQVCTEDFNTERKDREQAVQKARALQDDVTRLSTENQALKRQIEQLKKTTEQQPRQLNKPPSYEASLSSSSYSNESSPPPQYSSQFSQNSSSRYPYQLIPVQESPAQSVDHVVAMPFSDYTATSTSNAQNSGHRSHASQSDMRINYTNLSRQGTYDISGSTPPSGYSANSEFRNYGNMTRLPAPYIPGSSTPPIGNSANVDMRNYASMTRSAISSHPGCTTPPLCNTSMPPLTRRGGNGKEEIPCPKCSKKFSEDVLMSHIDACTQ